jgi:glycosyltransferase involved in cell wall biosynthesis
MKISIITINYNNAPNLRRTIESVINQTYRSIEYLVIDGGSNDGSADIIKEFGNKIDYWVSEEDKGIYDAMNKGLIKATGDYVLYLNSGDYFADNNVLSCLILDCADKDIIYGNIGYYKNDKLIELKSAEYIHFKTSYQHNLPPHPAFLIKRVLLEQLNGFDEDYPIIADVVMIAKAFSITGVTSKFNNTLVTVFDMNGVSSRKQHQKQIWKERKKFIKKEFPEYLPELKKNWPPNIFKKILNFVNRLL